jgi:hypothetical protein
LRGTISSWFRGLARRHHPDAGGSDAAMRIINSAREQLVDALERQGVKL